jgi:hypothetical protein
MLRYVVMLIVMVAMGSPSGASEAAPSAPEASAPAGEAKTQTHDVEAEVVSVDDANKTITIKTAAGESTAPVEEKAQAALKDLKVGQKVTIVCHDDEKGGHKSVAEIKPNAEAAK